MGVHGLWKLLDPSGKPVPLETLENKVLAVDVSIWLHQVVKGFQDAQGNSLPNAHLLGLFHRVCKLLFYKIKPVFVFDGGVPHLKKQTVAARHQQKSKAELEAERVRELLLKNLVKHTALKKVLGNPSNNPDLSGIRQKKENDMFELPPKKLEKSLSGSEDDSESSDEEWHTHKNWSTADLHAIDVTSEQFKSLPADIRHDILSELKETRKQSSWGRLHEMPKESSDFSSYQMSRLLKRRSVQVSLEDAKREMGGRSLSLGELENLLTEQGVVTDTDAGKRIASDSTTRYLYVKEIGNKILAKKSEVSSADESTSSQVKEESKPSPKVEETKTESTDNYFKEVLELIPEEDEGEEDENDNYPDWDSNSDDDPPLEKKSQNKEDFNLKMAQNFMFENSGLTQEQILAVIKFQKAAEDESQESSECFVSPCQPSTSGSCSNKETTNNVDPQPSTSGIKNIKSQIEEIQGTSIAATQCDDQSTIPSILMYSTSSSFSSIDKSVRVKDNKSGVDSENSSHLIHRSSINNNGRSLINNGIQKQHDLLKINEGESLDCKINSEITSTEVLKSSEVVKKNTESTLPIVDVSETQQSSSDTDNESFVEVHGITPLLAKNNAREKKSFEVIIDKNKATAVEDDIFADIFTSPLNTVSQKSLQSPINITLISNDKKELPFEASKRIPSNVSVLKDAISVTDVSVSKVTEDINIENVKNEIPSSVVERLETTPEKKAGFDQEVTALSEVSSEELKKLKATLEEEHKGLIAEQGRQERLAANITDQMCMEAQELLQLFGVPYLIAPMEAEAQCAFLDLISLTDGTITDDSDIWLFGGQQVYKNFFNQKKHVMHFKACDIKHCFKLEREQMILLAILVGSDYTPGIQGVGPVTALEILASFPPTTDNVLAGLQKFRDWLNGGMKVAPGKTPLKNKLRNVKFTEGFPSLAVVDAYLNPKVDESKETFSWAMPDVDSLRDFTRRKFGWTKIKADEILLPVMKKQEERISQRSLDSYFKIIPKIRAAEGQLSKRVQEAIHRIGRTTGSESEDEPSEVGESSQPKRRCIEITQKPKSSRGRGRGRGKGRATERGSTINEAPITEQQPSTPVDNPASNGEFIPQRERDKINALKSKLKAIEVFRTSKIDKGIKKQKKIKRKILKEAKLSESSSNSD